MQENVIKCENYKIAVIIDSLGLADPDVAVCNGCSVTGFVVIYSSFVKLILFA